MSFKRANSLSGLSIADDSKDAFLELKRKKGHRYVVFKIDEKRKEVVVEKTGTPVEGYDDFVAALPGNDCRFAVYDYDFVTSDNCQRAKYSLLHGHPQPLAYAQRCYMPHQRRTSSTSSMGFIMRFKLPIPQKWILKCSRTVHTEKFLNIQPNLLSKVHGMK